MTIRDIAIAFGYEVDKKSEKKVNDSINNLKSVAAKALGAIAVVFSIKGLASLSEAAANAEALESQFSQVFGNIGDQASKTLNGIADDTGVAVNRMKGSFTQIAAFAKTSGMQTEDALSLTDRAMRAVADSAAFYDKSLEQVTESLQSFLKGNFANDAALGLSATETTRNTAANALYGKSFAQLSEDQKQLTLLKMVEDANKLSGAFGQAARESDTWGNQLGNLKQRLKDLKASAGGALLKPAVQVLKLFSLLVGFASDAVKSLTAEGKLLNRMFERVANWLKKTQVYIERFVKKIGGAENAFKLLAIAASSILVAMNAGSIIAFLKKIPGLLNPVNLKILGIAAVIALLFLAVDDFMNFMQGNDSVIGTIFESWGIDADAVRKKITDVWNKIKSFLLTVWKTIQDEAAKVFLAVRDYVVSLFERLKENGAVDNFKTAFEKTGTAVEKVFKAVAATVDALFGTTSDVAGGIQPFIAWLIGVALPNFIGFLADIVGGAADLISWLGKTGALKPLIIGLVAAFAAYKAVVLASSIAHKALDFSKLVSGGAKAVKTFTTLTAAKIKDKIETIQIIGLYAKDYITAFGKTVASMAKATTAWVANTAKIVANKAATIAVAAAQKTIGFASFIASIVKAGAAWVANTASMAAGKAAMLAMSVAQKAVAAAQWLLNAAMSANPIGIIIVLIAGLVTAFVLLWNKSEGFRNFFIKMWEGIKSAAGTVVEWFKSAWASLMNGFSPVADYFKGQLDNIVNFFTGLFQSVKGIFNGIIDFITGVFTGNWDKAWEGVKSVFKNIVDGLAAIFKLPINWIIEGINLFLSGLNKLKIPDWVPGVGGKGINIPLIPKLAKGGVLAKGQIGYLEGDGAEAVVPLEKNTEWIQKVAELFKAHLSVKDGGLTDAVRAIAALARSATANPGTVRSMTTSTTNRSVIQNNYFDSTFNGDQAGQKRSAEAMNKSANDATGELARALAYVR